MKYKLYTTDCNLYLLSSEKFEVNNEVVEDRRSMQLFPYMHLIREEGVYKLNIEEGDILLYVATGINRGRKHKDFTSIASASEAFIKVTIENSYWHLEVIDSAHEILQVINYMDSIT